MSQPSLTTDPLLRRYTQTCLATAYVPLPSDIADGAKQRDVHLRHTRDAVTDIADDAAAERLVTAIEGAGHSGGSAAVAIVGEDDAHVWHVGMELPDVDVSAGPLPDLSRLLLERQTWLPHAVVEVDRIGADLTIATRSSSTQMAVDGADSHITKSNPGGWSQRRFQQRAEEHWEDNMRLVAERLTEEVRGEGLDLILVAGDEQVLNMLRDDLPQDLSERIVDLHRGGRADDGSEDSLAKVVADAVRREASRRRSEARSEVLGRVGSGDGVTGRTAVLEALFEGTVDTLVIHLDKTEGLYGHIGEEPIQVAADASVLHDLGLTATRVPLVDAALRGAAATGAAVVITHDAAEDIPDGLAASLRT